MWSENIETIDSFQTITTIRSVVFRFAQIKKLKLFVLIIYMCLYLNFFFNNQEEVDDNKKQNKKEKIAAFNSIRLIQKPVSKVYKKSDFVLLRSIFIDKIKTFLTIES